MKTKLSAKQKILNTLKSGKSLTVEGARKRFGISNVYARIEELRLDGHNIMSLPSRNKGFGSRPRVSYKMGASW